MAHLTNSNNLKNAGFGVAINNNDQKIEIAINEAEQIHVKARITDALYLDLLKYIDATDTKKDFPNIYCKLLNGGEWQSGGTCGEKITRYFDGLINAVNYYAYARLILKADENITRSGLTLKDGEYSTRPDPKIKHTTYQNALHTADIFMNDVVLFLNDNRAEIPLFRRSGAAKNRLSVKVIKS